MINLGIVGVGGWGKNLLRNFQEIKGARVAVACDLVEKRRAEASLRYPDLRVTADLDEIVAAPEIQAVVVATPGATHARIALQCLEAGKHVFVEKPMALTARDCESMIAVAEKKGLTLMVGHLLLYHGAVRKLKELLAAGAVGDLHYLYTQRLNLGKIRRSEDALWTFAPHDVSVALYLVGARPVSVSARGESYVQKGVADIAFAWLSFPGNVLAHHHVSWLDPHKIRRTTVVGARKMIVFDDMDSAEPLRIYDKGVGESLEYDSFGEYLNLRYGDVHIPAIKIGEPLKAECSHFLDCVREGKRPLTDGRNGLDVVRVLEAASRSMRENGRAIALA